MLMIRVQTNCWYFDFFCPLSNDVSKNSACFKFYLVCVSFFCFFADFCLCFFLLLIFSFSFASTSVCVLFHLFSYRDWFFFLSRSLFVNFKRFIALNCFDFFFIYDFLLFFFLLLFIVCFFPLVICGHNARIVYVFSFTFLSDHALSVNLYLCPFLLTCLLVVAIAIYFLLYSSRFFFFLFFFDQHIFILLNMIRIAKLLT